MRWAEWKFSARRAAQDRFVLWTTVTTVVLLLGMTTYFLVRILPEGWRSGVIVTHYNIYLGIDDVRAWPWILPVPGLAFVLIAFDLVFAFGLFRRDPLASRTIIAIGFATTVLWAIGSFFLLLVNA